MKKIIVAFFSLLFTQLVFSQGDGPRSYMLAPKGVTGLNVKYISLNQNFTPNEIFVPDADIKVNAFPLIAFHTFSIKGKFAQAYAMLNPTSFMARTTSTSLVLPIPVGTEFKANGLSDGFAAIRIGLYGTPALDVQSFIKEEMQFSIFADARYWFSGTYDKNKYLNLGSNRNTIQFSLPMSIPLNKNRARSTWLEISPSVQFFTANNQPSKGNTANKLTQKPMFIIENHLSHNFNKKIWGTVAMRYRQGGVTTADEKKHDNKTEILGTSFGLGCQIIPFMGVIADYGKVLYGYNGAQSDMLRISLLINYANMKQKD